MKLCFLGIHKYFIYKRIPAKATWIRFGKESKEDMLFEIKRCEHCFKDKYKLYDASGDDVGYSSERVDRILFGKEQ